MSTRSVVTSFVMACPTLAGHYARLIIACTVSFHFHNAMPLQSVSQSVGQSIFICCFKAGIHAPVLRPDFSVFKVDKRQGKSKEGLARLIGAKCRLQEMHSCQEVNNRWNENCVYDAYSCLVIDLLFSTYRCHIDIWIEV